MFNRAYGQYMVMFCKDVKDYVYLFLIFLKDKSALPYFTQKFVNFSKNI